MTTSIPHLDRRGQRRMTGLCPPNQRRRRWLIRQVIEMKMSCRSWATGNLQEGILEARFAQWADDSTVWAAPGSRILLEDEHGLGRARPGDY